MGTVTMLINMIEFGNRHGILHKPSASIEIAPKSFHKNSVIFDIFGTTNSVIFDIFGPKNCRVFVSSGHIRSVQFLTIFTSISAL